VVKCEERIFDIVVEKTSGSLRLRFLEGCGVERRRSERLLSESESSSECVALAEEDRGCSSASESDASEDLFRSTPPADPLLDDDGDNDGLGPAGLRFLAGTFFLPTSAIALVLRFLVRCDGIAFACFTDGLVCSVRLLVRN